MIFIIGNANTNVVSTFEAGTIEDKNYWVYSSNIANFSNDFKAKMVFGFENETLGIGLYPYLTFSTNVDIPFNFTGYLNKDINRQIGTYGVQISGYPGNITIGLNGTVIVKTPVTDVFYIQIKEGTTEIVANFETFIGENITLPINFNSMTFSIKDPDDPSINSIFVEIDPEIYLVGTIALSAVVNDQKLEWRTGNEIYFDSLDIDKEMEDLSISFQNISMNFEDLSLRVKAIDTSILLETDLGDFVYDYKIDLQNVQWIEGQQMAGEFLVLLIDTLINIDDQIINLMVFRASISLYSTLITMVVISTLFFIRRKNSLP
jgi:hypothetical protein